MFSDCNIAKKFQLGRIKSGYIAKFGIAPHFLDLFYKEILLLPVFVISFHESLNRIMQNRQMHIIYDSETMTQIRFYKMFGFSIFRRSKFRTIIKVF